MVLITPAEVIGYTAHASVRQNPRTTRSSNGTIRVADRSSIEWSP